MIELFLAFTEETLQIVMRFFFDICVQINN